MAKKKVTKKKAKASPEASPEASLKQKKELLQSYELTRDVLLQGNFPRADFEAVAKSIGFLTQTIVAIKADIDG